MNTDKTMQGPRLAPAPIPAANIYDVATQVPDFNAVGFAGGGGSTLAYTLAGHRVHVALNHNAEAMAMHRRNHAFAEHFIEDIRTVNPRVACGGRKLRSAWFSPDCRDFSKAKQGKPKSKRIRGLAWVIIHWINSLGPLAPDVIFLENVEEFAQWCSLTLDGKRSPWRKGWFFRCFVGALERRGYQVEWREQRACNYGAPTIRKRLFLVARRDGQPIVWPAPTHGAPESEGVQSGCLQPWRTAAECIDFDRVCPSIFMTRRQARAYFRKTGVRIQRPLARASLRRIAVGVWRHVMQAKKPFLVCLTHQGNDGVESIDAPFKTITAANRGERALVAPVLAYGQHGGATRPVTSPTHTIAASTKDTNGVISAFLVPRYGERPAKDGHAAQEPRSRAVTEPMPTVVNTGNGGNLVSVFLAQNNGGENGNQSYGHGCNEPVSTISGKGSNQSLVAVSLVKYYGAEQDPQMTEPLHSVTTLDRFGLLESELVLPVLTPELAEQARRVAKFLRRFGITFEGEFAMVGDLVIVGIGMRMLVARELYRAQGFPDSYVIDRGWVKLEDGTIEEIVLSGKAQVKMCGNSVSPVHAAAIIRANLGEPLLEAAA